MTRMRRMGRDASPSQIAAIKRMALRVAKLRGKSKHESALVLADMMEEADWPSGNFKNLLPTGRKGAGDLWNVFSLDVWGNRRDGYEINQQFSAGSIRFPTSEYISNVLWYRNHFLKTGIRDPSAFSIHYETDDEDLYRYFKREYLHPTVKRRQVVFINIADGVIEVQAAKDGKPLYIMEAQNR